MIERTRIEVLTATTIGASMARRQLRRLLKNYNLIVVDAESAYGGAGVLILEFEKK